MQQDTLVIMKSGSNQEEHSIKKYQECFNSLALCRARRAAAAFLLLDEETDTSEAMDLMDLVTQCLMIGFQSRSAWMGHVCFVLPSPMRQETNKNDGELS